MGDMTPAGLAAPVLLPESAPFTPAQRAWLNGYFAAIFAAGRAVADPGVPATPAPAAADADESAPWHDAAIALDERMRLADGRPLRQRMMAAMGQLDCGQCGYLCRTYAEAVASGAEKDLRKCVPGGRETAKVLRTLAADVGAAAAAGTAPAAATRAAVPGAAPAAETPAAEPGSRTRPFRAALRRSERLNGTGSDKPVQNVVLSVAGSGIVYEPGDSLGVWPTNYPEEVELLLAILKARGSEPVALPGGGVVVAREALLRECDLRVPTPELYRLLSRHARDDIEATRLARFAANDSDAAGIELHDVLDVLVRFRSSRPTIAEFVGALARMQPRLYSIASSQRAHPDEVHLTVAVVRYDLYRRGYRGVASSFFAEDAQPGARVPVFVQRSHGFRLPEDAAAPVIMVGPGTGIAPFRAFLEERAATGARGRNWLFFGAQHGSTDFLYRAELAALQDRGVLTRLDTAFSRDQAGKVYVQHRMLERAADLWRWLDEGAFFYVCGDAKHMAGDVDRALRRIAMTAGGLDEAGAAAFVSRLTAEGRYRKDVY
jgi:sulfite reductase (NADPH) flavoprotein alpha-component